MAEKELKDFYEQLKNKLETLFLHTTFTTISFLKGEIAKHLDINESNITLREERSVTDDNGNVVYTLYTLKIFDYEFVLRFNRRVTEGKEIDVPRVVKNPHKWWQFNEPDTKVVVEKKVTAPSEYWLLATISV